ncbi:bifunctional 3,4-dihydroxy-2-butanone-4-phosphate synthase/GTP cyclohydrolase II [Blastococcus sp. MG754426]|uniref:bifunctional 3,4-dihydroxy-2-butanone-4-phosphate synthase/GTP cyclohydrolase II n=1 Tax=unclassified Blastococcus TaxID=2619396 RepID=UPI001EF0EABA|nr:MULTISPECIES: bifunctional 3,4-dihydroxy-2-butanone-4-phosphate synthase/GTP cyclohydrolase II [unclassified Blastococcus]MCF6509956.1 bifunctional 3,4-dihydroxy-2-butanone-4-phosphate synthase/GTP cyclohydrolase II [Blastococcus sp. MG754426]MCF6513523.1 bifunctional 3,4-dihydroxy-2-butanone-4-phosphate synthase/GTP cyclohydrolase II [Blastococcus sp. MG754427]MCF6737525.1 bifunctional 3,4-dihydroxy-2-butanone-4-phosphate synthase/GTP cyclohydrolase II [Blastococcus sp. KM273129]
MNPPEPFRATAGAVQSAVAALAGGELVVVVDDADREDEGDLVGAAELVTPDRMAFLVRHTTGIVCVPMSASRADDLRLPLMVADSTDLHETAFTVSVDAAGTGTGVSAADRAATVRALADPATRPGDLRRPGHVFPLRARAGGVLRRAGHTEAAVDLLTMAGLSGVGVISEILADDGSMRRGPDLRAFAAAHGLPLLAVADLVRYRRASERLVEPVGGSAMPTAFGDFRAVAYRSTLDGVEHLALVLGDVAAAGRSEAGVLVRVHSECLTGDILGSLRCDCGAQLEQALRAVAAEGCGVVVYLRGHEGRGIGLGHKIRAYALQELGLDTVDANTAQGLPVDSRSYGVGAQILADLGVLRLRLITNNPAKHGGLDGHGLQIVDRVALPTAPTPHDVRYLRTKRDRLGHTVLTGPETADTS